MKRLIAAAGLLGVGLALALTAGFGRAPLPTQAPLPTPPGMGVPNQSPSTTPSFLRDTPGQTSAKPSDLAPWMTLPVEEPNKDLLVTPAQGPWMILLISYAEQEKDDITLVVRDLIHELRND